MSQSVQVALTCLHLRQWATLKKLKSLGLLIADHQYYKKPLQERRSLLNAPSIDYLCKTIVLQNKAYDQKFASKFYPRYICVVFQYITRFHSEKLAKFTKLYQNNNCEEKAGNKHFHWRLVQQTKSVELTGYVNNGVTPVLMTTPIPIVISHKIEELKPQFFWMGGGHPIIKMSNIVFKIGISLQEFKSSADDVVLIGNVTDDDKKDGNDQ